MRPEAHAPPMMARYIAFVLRRRAVVCGLIAVITVFAGIQISRASFGSSLVRIFFGASQEYDNYRDLITRFGASDVMVVVYEDETLFSPNGFKRLQAIDEALSALSYVRRVDSIHTAQRLRSDGDELRLESYGDIVGYSTSSAAVARAEVVADDLLGGLLVSRDGTHVAVAIEFTNDENRPAEQLPKMVDDVTGCFHAAGIASKDVHVAGLMPESSEATRSARVTLLRTFPLTALVLIVVVWLLFRRLWPVTITVGVALISVVWAVAFSVYLDKQINLLIAAVPAVVMVICFSDIIHLCSAYLLELQAGADKDEAILTSGTEVGVACFFTSLTTFVGFVSLAWVPAPAFRQMGLVLGFGVAVALLLALTLVPIGFSLLPRPELPKSATVGAPARVVDWIGRQSFWFSTHNPRLTIALFGALIVVCLVGITRIEIETNFLHRLDKDNPIRQSTEYVRQHFDGTNVLDVYVASDAPDGLLDPTLMANIAKAQDEVQALPEVDRASSVVNLFRRIGRATGSSELPETRSGLAQYLLLFDISGGDGLDRMIDSERSMMRYSVRLSDNGFVATARAGERIADIVRARLGPTVTVTPTGLSYIFGDWVDNIMRGQKKGLAFCIFATAIMMLICLRSPRAGLWSMIPNLLPVAVLGGYVGLAWDTVDTDTMLVGMIGIGIGVDDTIHFLTRLRIECARTHDLNKALERSFHLTGRAIVQTTLILAAGFLPFLTSDYFSTRILGSLLPMVLVVALAADLLLVPALIKVGWLRFPGPVAPSSVSS